MNLYKTLRTTLDSKPIFFSYKDNFNLKSDNLDYYTSLYYYKDEHKTQFLNKGSLAGIKDTVTDKLYFDFDDKDNLENSRNDAINLVKKLMSFGIEEDSIKSFFTGSKGFAIELKVNELINPEQFKSIVFGLASEYDSFDEQVKDANRIIRIPNTKHQDTGLYKIELHLYELDTLSIPEIRALAKKPRQLNNVIKEISLTKEMKDLLNVKPKVKPVSDAKFDVTEVDFTHKVKGWTNCKWALLNGYQVKANDRHEKLLCIISQAKALNNTKEQAYQLAKEADRYGVSFYGGERIVKEDLWAKVESVFSDSWKGGTFTCKSTPWLADICSSLGVNKCTHRETENLVDVDKVFSEFFSYAKDIEKNTIKTGIQELDANLRITVGQMVGLLGAPSSGKTALALEVLENTSRAGLLSVFYSLDMASSELFQKIAQRVTGYSDTKLFDIFKNNPAASADIGRLVSSAYTNVKFCFDTGVSVDKIESTIDEFENSSNRKVKLLLLDYNELLSSPHSDATASSGHNAGAIKKLTNSRGLCTISLLQPPKVTGDASDEIVSYRSIKGSSLLEQCFSIVIGIYRPGFSSENNSQDDLYMVMNVLKNRLGKLFSLTFKWNGARGKISASDEQDKQAVKELKDNKRAQSGSAGLNF